jgi:lipopolysaccharide export LptBFGC system permease protein LptF
MKPMSPLIVGGIAITLAFVNLLTFRIPTGESPISYLLGYFGVPVIVTIVYAIWYVRRYPGA